MRASWIARNLKPSQLESYQNRKPFLRNVEIEENLDELIEIINELEMINDPEKQGSEKLAEQKNNEKTLIEAIRKMLPKFYKVREIVMQYDLIVDYLYEVIKNDLNYIGRQLQSIFKFYQQYPEYKKPETMAYRDVDYLALTSFYKELQNLLRSIADRKISLDDMVAEYLEKLESENSFFPKIENPREDDYIASPTSAVMPDRFIFIGFTKLNQDGKLKEKRILYAGQKVKKDLALGFNPGEDPEINPYQLDMETGELNIRGGIKWMTDYETAVKNGMAITVPLPHNDEEFKTAKFDSVFVLGVKDKTEKNIMEDFFNGHIYGESHLDFLKINTPTNSLDEIVSGYNSDESLLEEKRYEIDILEEFKNQNKPLHKSLSRIFGIDEKTFERSFGRVNSYDNNEIEKAEKTNKQLSEFFKDQFTFKDKSSKLGKSLDDFLKKVPDFITEHCFSRGIVPPMRIGNQPYGILPTTAFSRFELNPIDGITKNEKDRQLLDFAQKLLQLLRKITHIWDETKNKYVIHFENLTAKNKTESPEERYMEMMGLTPVSVSFFERMMVESLPILHPPVNYLDMNQKIGLGKIIKDIFDVRVDDFSINNEILDELPLFHAYPIDDMLEEFKEEASKDPSLKPFLDKVFDKTNKNELLKYASEKEIPYLVAEFLDLFTHRLDAWWLGLVNYQLSRIRNGNFGKPTDQLSFGAFGWLFDLEKRVDKKPVSRQEQNEIVEQMNLSDAETPIYKDPEHNEFILAPSHAQAVTAAVLRSGYNKRKSSDNKTNLSINLTSFRVRQAIRIIEGIRNGLSMGAILGADLERAMHEAYKLPEQNELDRYILPLRKLFPLKIDLKSEQQDDDSYQMSLINAELMLNKISYDDDTKTIGEYLLEDISVKWFHDLFENSTKGNAHKKHMAYLIEQIGDAVDALSDLILSEGVYHLVQGNRVTFKAWMDSLKDGNFNNNPQVSEFPMHSASISHQVGIAFGNQKEMPAGWENLTYENQAGETVIEEENSILAKLEPNLNYWIGSILGNPEHQKFSVEISNTDEDENVEKQVFSLQEMQISPLEYLYLSENPALFSRFLELKIRDKEGLWNEKIKIDFKADLLDQEDRNLFCNDFLLKKLRNLVANSRSMNAEDFSKDLQLEGENLKAYDLDELEQRVEVLLSDFEDLQKKMNRILDQFQISQKEERIVENPTFIKSIIELIVQLASLGIIDAIINLPKDLFVNNQEDIKAQNQKLRDYLDGISRKMNDKLQEARKSFSKEYEDADSLLSGLKEVVHNLAFKNFNVIPLFSLDHLPEKSLENQNIQLDSDFSYENVDRLKLENWLWETSKVRNNMDALHVCRMFKEFHNEEEERISVLQFPYEEEKDSEWLGLEVSSEDFVEDKNSLLLLDSKNHKLNESSLNSGIIIDRWMELIPYKNQNGGVVFNYDNPDAEAPQSILLAIPAKIRIKNGRRAKNWTLDDLLVTLQDTKDLMEKRAVEPDHFYRQEEYAKIFPLLKYDFKNL